MAVYTTELRNVIRVAETQAHGSYTEFEYTDATWRALGLDEYPIYDESHRAELNRKICDHFYMREIGAETVALFRLFVRRTMNEVMPFYNELYKTASLITDPFEEISVTHHEGWGEDTESNTSSTGSTSTTSTTTMTNESSSSSLFSDTPMSMIQDDGGTLLESGQYATTSTFDKSSADTETSGQGETGTESRTDSSGQRAGSREWDEKGHRKSPAELVMEYRRAILNVDNMVLHDSELNDCFMNVY